MHRTADDDLARRRVAGGLFGGVASGATAVFAVLTVHALAAEDLTGSATWSGIPSAAGVVGTAVGAAIVSHLFERVGRRRALARAYLAGAVGAALGVLALRTGMVGLLVVGAVAIGAAQSANHLSRYVAAEVQPPARRGRALAVIVWASTVGGVVGPAVLAPSARLAAALGLPDLAGPYVVAALVFTALPVWYRVALRRDPGTLVVADHVGGDVDADATPWRDVTVRTALVVLLAGQVVMVLLMTMTPIHLRHSGAGLDTVGFVLSAHVVGMYALAPLVGWVVDRAGALRVAAAGLLLLALAGLLAALAPARGVPLGFALFVLGLGWSCGFVAGSALLARGVDARIRVRVQGRVETLVWATSALASLSSGVLLGTVGYLGLALFGAALTLVPAVIVLRWRRGLAPEPA